jgi:hypothetical protein
VFVSAGQSRAKTAAKVRQAALEWMVAEQIRVREIYDALDPRPKMKFAEWLELWRRVRGAKQQQTWKVNRIRRGT